MSHTPASKQRPLGITILSLILGWLAVAGFGNAIVWNLQIVRDLARQIPNSGTASRMPLGGPMLTIVLLAYGATAAASCIGLWRMKAWAHRAYLAWCAVVLVSGIGMAFLSYAPSLLVGLVFAAGMAGFVSLAYPYISRRIGNHAL